MSAVAWLVASALCSSNEQWQRRGQCGSPAAAAACRPLPPVRAAEAEAAPADEQERTAELVGGRPGYRSFQLEGCEFLVAESPEGLLDLQDSYVTTEVEEGGAAAAGDGGADPTASGGWRRPEGLAGVTRQTQRYQAVPWYSEYPGDIIAGKEPKTWVWRYYLVPVVSEEPETQLSFDEIYVLDGKAASLARCEVHNLAPPDTPPEDLRLRIRDDVVTVDTIQSLPEYEHAVQARIHSVPALSKLEQQRLRDYLEALESARKLGTIDETDFETAHDVHWLAGMLAGGAGVSALGGVWASGGESDAEGGEGMVAEQEEEVMGGWDQELFEDLMGEYDEEGDGDAAAEFDDFDSPAADY
ncbi:acetoin utilization [Micractinium conductrix]|uniref:Acetoin utilization n=1 Tax=Micractinium conductrix TaxID=554055 RepID=A0A2P6VBA2_9CHLO|nr:acetoin utilization [Micractinium conductrix]|eukprot:PSC71364.1 acetoin utilization [Micractinium conductrix]